MSERLQKVLAARGLGSRREIERWIEAGRLQINGHVATLGEKVGPGDRVLLDGRPVSLPETPPPPRVIAYHKPVGEVTTRHDEAGRPTVFDALPELHRGRWVAVGRLDINTCGLLLMTTDGHLASALMHPSAELDREYAVRVMCGSQPPDTERLLRGVQLDDGPARFHLVEETGGEGTNRWYRVVLREGRKREVRRLWEAVGCKVSRLIRVRFGPALLPRELPRGRWRDLKPGETRVLYRAAGLAVPEDSTPERERERKPARRGPWTTGPRRRGR